LQQFPTTGSAWIAFRAPLKYKLGGDCGSLFRAGAHFWQSAFLEGGGHRKVGSGMFKETHPILGTRDIQRAIGFYTTLLGFTLAFVDNADEPAYVGFRRDAVALHMQFQFEHEMGTIRLRFLVDDPDSLFDEYRQVGVESSGNGIRNTAWGTREFALYDLDRNALTFYRHLTSAERDGGRS
jgi:catechol 2,3-dioxygenase-like lactoylglutathione lyase family enzyme